MKTQFLEVHRFGKHTGMSNSACAELYANIIEEVIIESRQDFENAGIDEQTLQDLRNIWKQRLAAAKVAPLGWGDDDDDDDDDDDGKDLGVEQASADISSAEIAPNMAVTVDNPGEQKNVPLPQSQQQQILQDAHQLQNFQELQQQQQQQQQQHQQQQQDLQLQKTTELDPQISNPQLPNLTNHTSLQPTQSHNQTFDMSFIGTQNNGDGIKTEENSSVKKEGGDESVPPFGFPTSLPTSNKNNLQDPTVTFSIRNNQLDGSFDFSAPKENANDSDSDDDLGSDLGADSDAINSDLDDSDDEDDDSNGEEDDEDGENGGANGDIEQNIMLCLYDRVQRVRNRWKCSLKDGLMNINGKDYVFQKATGDSEW